MTEAEHLAERERSYTVREATPIGSTVTLNRDVPWGPITYFAGTQAIVRDYQNAGFRGIEAILDMGGGHRITISAGLLDPVA